MQDGLQSDANSLDVLMSLADLYVKNGLIEEAKELLKTAIEQNKNSVEPYLSLSKIYLNEDNREKALKILGEALKIEPGNKTLKNLLKSIEEETVKEYKKEEREIEEEEEIEKVEEEIMVREKEETQGMPLDELINAEMDKLLKIEGIMGIIMVDDAGSLVFAKIELPLDDESTGAIINTIYSRINETVKDLNLGQLNEVIIELPGGDIFVLGTTFMRFIALVKKDIHIASIEENLKEIFDRTRSILGVN